MKKKLLNKLIPILFTFFIFIGLSCSNNDNEKIEIKFWAMGSEAEVITRLIPEFEKQNPGIKVSVQQIPWTAAQEKLITAFASDNTPDLCQLGNTWIPQFQSLNTIVNLGEWINNSEVISKENYFEGIWETNVIDGKVYGIPWYIDTRLLFYRTDIFEKAGYDNPPKTWDEFLNISRDIKALYKNENKYAIYLPTNEWNSFIIFGMQAGADLLKNNNSLGNFNSPEFKEAFEFLTNFHKENLAPAGITQVTNIYQSFAEEFIAMYISGPWNIPEFKKWMSGKLADKWMTAPLPGYDGEYPGISLAGGSSLIIFEESKHKEETWKLIEYLSLSETQIEFYKLLNNLPAVREAWEDSLLKNDPYMQAFYEQFYHVVPMPKVPEWEQIVFSKVQHYAEFTARGAMSVDDALRSLDKDVDKILEKRRWLLSRANE
jgi:multiple sugar transport system substrate-binding protein